MNKKELETFAKQAAKSIKSEQDLTDFRKILTKITVEITLIAEINEHLGYSHRENPTPITAEMAIPRSLFALRMVKLSLKHHAIKKAVLNQCE